jgi:hypothetical protein
MQPQLTKITDGITFEKMVDFAKKDPSEDQRKIQTTDLIQFQFVFIKYLLQCF